MESLLRPDRPWKLTVAGYCMPADACIRNLNEIWSEVRAIIATPDALIDIDASALQRQNSAVARLLAMAVLRSRELGKKLTITNARQPLRDQVRIRVFDFIFDE